MGPVTSISFSQWVHGILFFFLLLLLQRDLTSVLFCYCLLKTWDVISRLIVCIIKYHSHKTI